MAPKSKFTKGEIAEAALRIVREKGSDCLTAKAIADALGTSTRPVFTAFGSMEDVRRAVYAAAVRVYDRYAAEGMEDGGALFTVACSVNTSFEDLEEMTYIGFDEKEMLNYYAVKPTDYPAYAADAATKAEYDALWADVDAVIAGITLTN